MLYPLIVTGRLSPGLATVGVKKLIIGGEVFIVIALGNVISPN